MIVWLPLFKTFVFLSSTHNTLSTPFFLSHSPFFSFLFPQSPLVYNFLSFLANYFMLPSRVRGRDDEDDEGHRGKPSHHDRRPRESRHEDDGRGDFHHQRKRRKYGGDGM
jgi:hypothetical protein